MERSTYFFDDQLQRDPRRRPHVVDLQVLRFVEAVVRCESAEQRVRTFVQRHGAVGV